MMGHLASFLKIWDAQAPAFCTGCALVSSGVSIDDRSILQKVSIDLAKGEKGGRYMFMLLLLLEYCFVCVLNGFCFGRMIGVCGLRLLEL